MSDSLRAATSKWPRTLTIAGEKWRLRVVECHAEESNTYGETDINSRIITVYVMPHRMFPDDIRACLFHEAIHAALHSTGVANLLPGPVEETVVSALDKAVWPLVAKGLFD